MPSVIVAPDLKKMLVRERGIFTVEAEDATVACACPQGRPCVGILIHQLPLEHRYFEILAHQMEEMFVRNLASEGYELVGELRLHGPFPSHNFREWLVDANSSMFSDALNTHQDGEEHPEHTLFAIHEKIMELQDYIFIGPFLKLAVLTEIIIPEATPDG